MFVFDLLYECSQKVVPALSAGAATAGATYFTSNYIIDSTPSPVKAGLKLFGAGAAGLIAAIAVSSTTDVAGITFALVSSASYGALYYGGDKIQKSVTAVASISAGAVVASSMSGHGLFFNNDSSIPQMPYYDKPEPMPPTQHVSL